MSATKQNPVFYDETGEAWVFDGTGAVRRAGAEGDGGQARVEQPQDPLHASAQETPPATRAQRRRRRPTGAQPRTGGTL